MNSRRSFIKRLGISTAFSSSALCSNKIFATDYTLYQDDRLKSIRIGIIGAQNSHTESFGKIINTQKRFPGVEVLYVWGETEEFAKNAMKLGNIPKKVRDPDEMLGKIDALIVDHRHGKYHLAPAIPFIKAGIPTFIDKPFCYRSDEGKEFLALARKYKTPVTSFSTLTQTDATYDMKKQVAATGKISQIICSGPLDLDSEYGGVFFYGSHLIEPMMVIFGEDIESVKVTRKGKSSAAALVFKSGLFATLIFKSFSYSWETFVELKTGIRQLKSTVNESEPPKSYTDMINMFRTGIEPLSHQFILNAVAVLEALEKSAVNQSWVDVIY